MLQRPFIIIGLVVVGFIVLSSLAIGFLRRMSGRGPDRR